MTNLTPEMIAKVKAAKTPEELLEMAKEAGMEDFTAESAAAYFDQFCSRNNGELLEDELENVAGGGCHKDGELVVSALHTCEYWVCTHCGEAIRDYMWEHSCLTKHHCPNGNIAFANCTQCKFCRYKEGLWLCDENYAKWEYKRYETI